MWLTLSGGVCRIGSHSIAHEVDPIWSPDGSQLVFTSNRNSGHDLFLKPTSGTVEEQPLLITPEIKHHSTGHRMGVSLLYSKQDRSTASDMWALPMTGERKSLPFCKAALTKFQDNFRQTAGGWHIRRTSRDATKSTFGRFQKRVGNGNVRGRRHAAALAA